jgi:hypothetical protein
MVKGSDKGVSRESCAEATFLSVTRGSNRQRGIPASKRSKEGAERRRFRRIPPGYAGSKNRTVQDLGNSDVAVAPMISSKSIHILTYNQCYFACRRDQSPLSY